jgi:L-ascorbate metabolism protein UlaG (beta-lactamase superfamily)
MGRGIVVSAACALLVLQFQIPAATQAGAGSVQVTPLGSHAGELCFFDRAMVFEDPKGVRILYDPGRTVDESDPRLGTIDVVLLSHVHADHLGDVRPSSSGGTCAAPVFGGANANSNTASIAAVKRAAVVLPRESATFVGNRVRNILGTATPACLTSGPENETIVPVPTTCTAGLSPGAGARLITRSGSGSVKIVAVPALHENDIPAQYLDAPGVVPGVSASAGPAAGFVILFSNGLRAYLSGDTGVTAEMDMISRLYRPQLAVINVADPFAMGPEQAAFGVQQYIRPATVLLTHVNEQATNGGRVVTGTRADRFTRMIAGSSEVVMAVSGVTRSFDGDGRCTGCR